MNEPDYCMSCGEEAAFCVCYELDPIDEAVQEKNFYDDSDETYYHREPFNED